MDTWRNSRDAYVIEHNIGEVTVALLEAKVATLREVDGVMVDAVLFTVDKLYLVVSAENKEIVRQQALKIGLSIHRVGQIVEAVP